MSMQSRIIAGFFTAVNSQIHVDKRGVAVAFVGLNTGTKALYQGDDTGRLLGLLGLVCNGYLQTAPRADFGNSIVPATMPHK